MKRLLCTSLTLILVCFGAMAQSNQSFPQQFSTLGLSYHPMSLIAVEGDDKDILTFNGFGITWTNANAISTTIPLYIEYGVGAQYSYRHDQEKKNAYNYEAKYHLLSVKVPVEFLYRIQIPGSKVCFAPFAGLDAVVYALGRGTETVSDSKYDSLNGTSTFDLFSNNDPKLNRFNLDWHAGGKLMFGHFFVAAAYEGPILGFYHKDNVKAYSSQANISVGLVF